MTDARIKSAYPSRSIQPSPNWAQAMPSGPDTSVKITEPYARMVARDAYFWAWPMVNIYNRRLAFKQAPQRPHERRAALRTAQHAVHVARLHRTAAALGRLPEPGRGLRRWRRRARRDPVVVQVPDFGDRFWVYQVVDLRTDSFAQLGSMYGTSPGSTSWRGRTGRARCRRALPRCSAARPTPRSWCRASSRTTRRRTGKPSKRLIAASTCIRCPSSTGR